MIIIIVSIYNDRPLLLCVCICVCVRSSGRALDECIVVCLLVSHIYTHAFTSRASKLLHVMNGLYQIPDGWW